MWLVRDSGANSYTFKCWLHWQNRVVLTFDPFVWPPVSSKRCHQMAEFRLTMRMTSSRGRCPSTCVTSTWAAAQSHFYWNEEVVILLASIKSLLICTNDSHWVNCSAWSRLQSRSTQRKRSEKTAERGLMSKITIRAWWRWRPGGDDRSAETLCTKFKKFCV